MKKPIVMYQIGKAGISPEVISSLNKLLEHYKHVRISFLRSSGRTSKNMPQLAEQLVKNLNFPCQTTIIGFTIALRKKQTKEKK